MQLVGILMPVTVDVQGHCEISLLDGWLAAVLIAGWLAVFMLAGRRASCWLADWLAGWLASHWLAGRRARYHLLYELARAAWLSFPTPPGSGP